MTFLQIKQDAYRRLGFSSSPATEVATRIGAYVNEAYHDILSRPGMARLRTASTTFASVDGTTQYVIGTNVVERVLKIRETTNDITLEQRSLDWLRTQDPDPSEGTPEIWVPISWANTAGAWEFTVQLWPTPSSAITYTVDYVPTLTELSADGDEPRLPTDFHRLLSTGAVMQEYEKLDDSRFAQAQERYERGIRDCRAFLVNDLDYVIVPGKAEPGRSRMGAYFPAGS